MQVGRDAGAVGHRRRTTRAHQIRAPRGLTRVICELPARGLRRFPPAASLRRRERETAKARCVSHGSFGTKREGHAAKTRRYPQ